MKKILKVISFLSVFSILTFLITDTSFAAENDDSSSNVRDVKVTITNDETGETTILDDSVIKSESKENSTIEYDVFIPIEGKENNSGITTLAYETGGSQTAGGVTAKLNVNYDLRSGGEEIRLNKVYGSWTPSHTMYYLSNRKVDAHSGSVWGKSLSKTPTANTFSYTTGWGYNYFGYGDGSPRAWTSAKIHVSGMTATYTIKVEITFP